ncbi:MAG: ABC transporter ATP-binding protein [Rhodospirillum sp.]|nr:ABC transporter ATP-binding protein [Rhodospirillum sp.]MCF8487639.1 ABC transporter ATP-binding protein [Rhodospirillum sp.]MCF8499243.1 ABC transporter ATP-binding protein [Rhodospirillum sp.]
MLELREVAAAHGRVQALFGLSLTLAPGEGVALLGRNGAGKSSTLRAIMGLTRILGGSIMLDGREISALPTHDIARAGLGWVPEDRRVFAGLTVAENIRVGRSGRPGPWTNERLLALFPKLRSLWTRRAGHLSGGEQQMVTVARTLAGNPTLLLLDEPSEGLAPLVVDALAEATRAIKEEGVGILLSEQNMGFARIVADRVCLIDQGRVVWRGTLADLENDPKTQHQYLAV